MSNNPFDESLDIVQRLNTLAAVRGEIPPDRVIISLLKEAAKTIQQFRTFFDQSIAASAGANPFIKRNPGEFMGILLTDTKPQIVTLCGSSRFCAEMAVLAWEFEKGGAIALGLHLLPQEYCEQKGMKPDADGNIHHIGEQECVETIMDALHFKKIEMADLVFIVNVGGYIGSSTAREIAYARYLGKKVSYLEEHTERQENHE